MDCIQQGDPYTIYIIIYTGCLNDIPPFSPLEGGGIFMFPSQIRIQEGKWMRIRTHSLDWGKRCYAHFILLYSVHSKSDGYDLCRSAEWLFWPERNFWWLYWPTVLFRFLLQLLHFFDWNTAVVGTLFTQVLDNLKGQEHEKSFQTESGRGGGLKVWFGLCGVSYTGECSQNFVLSWLSGALLI